ncbi:type II toxin-antitoxin system RelE/ParE family toxin [Phaeobacter gallaeciensis]|uniref:type II toxin-antitoxin system RelE/ParE family toxin n=1 Tax=Phaeobacter gallaeciensis TaxID=60890 RepID=UPI00237F5D69|nr:type II toxin-antitoxin system RelE/ParE family toxin [Phaeobacter gallaeciensis]MDE4306259.1 type II toxin-antitoxin system RelE/ParE family toxin [Phaeobacter gallaeciensis]MDE4310725.1 type II toxin-antitoxin system RelE/ParE family toxin [Phaeobacter gallaeciensis]MDE4315146.1 type II toxin-antitoxin system RelE/ParE family toxin [Phaeobacter gallaeciensis]MDE4319669.1 type II toxin-antitoxin system RelE/ParE family toxin [Phaeobacter gallaeciensis]MDE4324097.1 type II toxin-antitoxin s
MRFVRHPFFERDLIGIVDHIVEVTDGDAAAALRRLDEIDLLLEAIVENPTSGVRLEGRLDGWMVRHGGVGHRLTIVFKPDIEAATIYLALAAFGGRNWMKLAANRQTFSP